MKQLEKGCYSGLSQKDMKKLIGKEGFSPQKVRDGPGKIYTEHTHPETKLLAILEGKMDVWVEDDHMVLKVGDKLIIPGDTRHKAVMGPEGCTYFWSEVLR